MKPKKFRQNFFGRYVFNRYFTFKKFFNVICALFNYVVKKEKLRSYPFKLFIDASNICNLRCPLCPTGQRKHGRTKAFLKFEDFKKIIDEVGDYLLMVDMCNWGDPMLNKDILKMINYAHNKNIYTRISSPMILPIDPKQFVDSGLDYLIISLDGASQETYEIYRRGGNFNKVVKNIKDIAAEKKRQHKKTPSLIWQFLVMKQNEHELPKVYKMAEDMGIDYVKIEKVRSDIGDEIFKNDETKIRESKNWLPVDSSFSRFDYAKKRKKVRKKSCIFLWIAFTINPNGSVSPCTSIYPEKYDFGNAFKEGLMGVWNNRKYVASRKLVSGKRSEISTVCMNCVKHGFIE